MTRTFILACTFVTVFIAGLRGKTLDSLVVEGATVYQPQVIRNAAGLRAGQQFNAVDIQKAVKSLYNQGLFKDVEIFSLNETDSTASLLVKVEEYPITESIEFSGMKKLRESELNEAVTLRQGQVASDATLFENIRLIKDAYAEEGYLRAEISPELVKTKTPGNVIVKFNIEEGPRVRVESIRFGGNKAFSEKKLKREFKTNEKKWYNSGDFERQKYERHLDSLVMFYRNKGYLDAQIVSDSVWYGDENKNIFIEITLDEGPQYVVGDFYFTGTSVLEADSLQKNIALKTGKPFQQQKFDMSKLFIANAYREEGYLWVQLNENFRYRADTIDVVFNIAEGSPAIVNRIDIQGNEKTLEKVIRRELQLHPGQKYKQSRMERSIREIMQLNYFDNVTPDLQPNENGTIDLLVDVEEKENIGQFTAGLTYSGLDGLGGTFSVTIPNFQGAGQELSANVEYAKRRQ
ncbi:MAG: outer membrane protein assembly factor BamA, partial [Fibrobacterota bacterium]